MNSIEESDETDNEWTRTFWIEEPTVTLIGQVAFVSPLPPVTVEGMDSVRVDLFDAVDGGQGDWLSSSTVDSAGWFVFGPIDNLDNQGGKLDLYLEIWADNRACYVNSMRGTSAVRAYSDTVVDIPSGLRPFSQTLDSSLAGPFFVANSIIDANRTWAKYSGTAPPKVEVELRAISIDTNSYYEPSENFVHIEASYNPSFRTPHTFIRDIINHEYFHYIQYDVDYFFYGGAQAHGWGVITSPLVAAREGSAMFMPCLVDDDSLFLFHNRDFSDTAFFNLESGTAGSAPLIGRSYGNKSESCEAAVACLLWDIYDSHDDDYSTDTVHDYYNPDGVWDSLSDDAYHIATALTERDVKGHPQNILEFWDAWFTHPDLGNCPKMEDIYYEHGIDLSTPKGSVCGCCMGDMRGNVDYDAGDGIDIADLVMLVDYMSSGGEAPPCWAEANIDGSCCGPDGVPDTQDDLDIADLVVLVDYMFTGGPEPWPCP